ncbi:GrpB family protein [Chloroflexi bacterium TSY]|nr:GrpB family protein [Chloroflexi bacterium TSY]
MIEKLAESDDLLIDSPYLRRPVIITEHRTEWRTEFEKIATDLRAILGNEVLRIDHIGSTSVSQLAAKDVIDIQLTVANLDQTNAFQARMIQHGFRQRDNVQYDNFCGAEGKREDEWRKLYFREPDGQRRIHLHVREHGRMNQRYALLFRDYLRHHANVRTAYQLIKMRLAEIFPDSIDGYLYIKDPMMDIMYEAALLWATATNWEPDQDYL